MRLRHYENLDAREIVAVLGSIDYCIVAEIIGIGLTADELAEARAWITNDEAMLNCGRPLATGRVSPVTELLALTDEEQEAEFQSCPS